MAEATNSVHLAKLRARLHFATRPQGNEGQSPRPRPEVHSLLTARHRCPSRRQQFSHYEFGMSFTHADCATQRSKPSPIPKPVK